MKDYYLTVSRLVNGNVVETCYNCHRVELLLSSIDKICDEAEQRGGYGTFSPDGSCKPVDQWEVVMTIKQDNKVLCPIAGGEWTLFDEHRKARKNVIMKYEKSFKR